MKTALLLLLLIIISGFRTPSVEIEVTGHLRSKTQKPVSGLVVFAKGSIENQKIATTNVNGDFYLHFNQSMHDTTPVSFYYVNMHSDTILLKRVSNFEGDTPEIIFWIK